MLLWFAEKGESADYFVGIPTTLAASSTSGSKHVVLSSEQQAGAILKISREGGDFYWTSRDGIQLRRHVSGIFEIFTAENGAGIVKIGNLDMDTFQETEEPRYFEVLHLGLETWTYFGKGTLLK